MKSMAPRIVCKALVTLRRVRSSPAFDFSLYVSVDMGLCYWFGLMDGYLTLES